jgi:hypothetical protein
MFVYGLNDYTKGQMTLEHILPCIFYIDDYFLFVFY